MICKAYCVQGIFFDCEGNNNCDIPFAKVFEPEKDEKDFNVASKKQY